MPEVATLVKNLLAWYEREARDLPWRHDPEPYPVWISEIMLQQTQVKTVIPYWERWMEALPTIRDLAEAPWDRVLKLWEGLGYYSRARNLQKAAQMIQSSHGGVFPETFEAILALPGVGRYTAGAIASIAFNQARPVVDGNVIRILTRIDGVKDNPKARVVNEGLWTRAESLVRAAARRSAQSPKVCGDLNQSLMELGATICLPRNPQCLLCPVRRSCIAYRQGWTEEIPHLEKRKTVVARTFLSLVLRKGGRLYVRQREEAAINGSMWEFPNTELVSEDPDGENWLRQWGLEGKQLTPIGTVKHSITNNRITVRIFACDVSGQFRAPKGSGKWLRPPDLDALALTAANRKIATRFLQS